MSGPEDHVALLRQHVRERLDDLRPYRPGSPEHVEAAERVLAATEELIRYEERLPLLADAPDRRLSLRTVRWCGRVTAAAALLLTAAALAGWAPRWWLALLLPVAAVGLRMEWLPVHGPGAPHVEQRRGAALVVAAVPFLVVAVTGAGSAWLAAPVPFLVLGGVLLLVRRTVAPPGDGPEEPGAPGGPAAPGGPDGASGALGPGGAP